MTKTENLSESWSPESWKEKPAKQQPEYENADEVTETVETLRRLPPLVTSWEVERLKDYLAEAAEGKRFVLQGGDCAETLMDCDPRRITNKLKILLQMSLVLLQGLKRPVVRIGRIAGQYAKPRSSYTETRDGLTLPNYFGDSVNGHNFEQGSRRPDPRRLITGHHHAALTLNFIRSLVTGGFADLHHPNYWNLQFLGKADLPEDLKADYQSLSDSLGNAMEVMEIISGRKIETLSTVEFFTSHEGLNLLYESAMTRTVPRREGFYNLGCHLPWIGERTRNLDGAHVEFFRGIRNPIGVKLGPSMTPEELKDLMETLDPNKEPGRLVLIGRFGADRAEATLPQLIHAAYASGRNPVWLCDPMHGNTTSTPSGIKTRRLDDIVSELGQHIAIHERENSWLSGVHFELTGDNVTECVGGASGVTEEDLDSNYETLCDPRLNYEQSMEMAFAIARRMGRMKNGG